MRRPTKSITKIALAATLLALAPAAGLADSGRQTIRYHGVMLQVPLNWTVYSLSKDPHTCVRFNRPAVYLGAPGTKQDCPANEIGRPQAILVEPRGAHRAVVVRSADPQLNTARSARIANRAHPDQPTADYIGKGFDACQTPTTTTLAGFTGGEYRAVGMYIGGANLGCSQPNVTPALVAWAENNGWHMIPTYVGLQAPETSCSCQEIPENTAKDKADGQGAAKTAVTEMQALGLGPGNPIYYDMEAYTPGGARTTAALAFLQAWTQQLHADGYLSGVYGSGDSTIHDLVSQYGSVSYSEPDELWVATFDGKETDYKFVPSDTWSAGQLLNQYGGGQSLHGMDVDYDYVDGVTAPYTALAPTVSPLLNVSTTSGGLVNAITGWGTTEQISKWELLGGYQPDDTDAPLAETNFGLQKPVLTTASALPYYEIAALDSEGSVVGSRIMPAPAHIAIYGGRAFVPASGDARLPVGCFWPTACNLSLTLRAAGQTIATSSFQHVASYNGGSLLFRLNAIGERLLARHRGGLGASATVTDRAGKSVEASIELTAYKTSGPPPTRYSAPASTLRLFGRTAFVVGNSGGVLAACSGIAPCEVRTTVDGLFGATFAQTGTETIGANQLGYLYFSLSKAARKLLDETPGNQLGVTVTMVNTVSALSLGFGETGTATGAIALTQAN
jgi:glycoside hydrolase-like protein